MASAKVRLGQPWARILGTKNLHVAVADGQAQVIGIGKGVI